MVVKNIALQVAIVSLSLCAAAGTKVWVGESGGLWGEASNWDPSGVPSYTDVVVFRPAGEMVVENKTVSMCNGMRFESGSVLLYSSANRIYLNTGTNDIYVAPGVTACVSNGVVSKGSDPRATPRKTGGGTLVITASGNGGIWGNDWGKISAFDFAEGVTELRCAGSSQLVCPITIRSGATVKSPKNYAFSSDNTSITIEKDGVLDLSGSTTVYMAGLNGAGVVTNAQDIISVRLKGGPYRFSGKLYPNSSRSTVAFKIDTRGNSSATDDEWKQYICSSDTFANVEFAFPTSSTGGCPLGFAAGVGTFSIARVSGNDTTHMILEDEDGLPVTVRTDYYNPLKLRLKGSGSLYTTVTRGAAYGSTVDISSFTGTLGVASGDLTLGNLTAETWPNLNPKMTIESLASGSSGAFLLKPPANGVTITNRIAGTGTYQIYGKATLLDFSTSGSWVQVRDNADYTVAGGYAMLSGNGLYMYTGSKLCVSNGAYVGGMDSTGISCPLSQVRKPYGVTITSNMKLGTCDISVGGRLGIAGNFPKTTTVRDGGIMDLGGVPDGGTADDPFLWTFDGGTLLAN